MSCLVTLFIYLLGIVLYVLYVLEVMYDLILSPLSLFLRSRSRSRSR